MQKEWFPACTGFGCSHAGGLVGQQPPRAGGESVTKKFDVIAIGTGTAATAIAHRCHAAGWQVAVVDSRPFGGTCALRGCDPKKVLVGAADVVDWVSRMNGNGV